MLQELGLKYKTDKAYTHYFCDEYERLLPKHINVLYEIGILDGASLQMWSEYYQTAKIIGFDIEDKSALKLNNNIEINVLDQGNKEQLKKLAAMRKDVDIIIDDGSHLIQHQILTFETLFDCLIPGGKYIIEDLHTSTTLHHGYNFINNKGALQYLYDIIQNTMPINYPGQYNTQQVISQIKDINIFSNIGTALGRSITAIITKR